MSSSFYSQIGIPSTNSTAIQSSVNQAATSETNSAASATNSASSASASAASATAANAADVSATQSKNAAEAAETNSAASATASATSATASSTSATQSQASAVTANTEATNAALSAIASTTQATNAAASATSAASSLAAIGTSVTDSAASATAAASSLSTFQNQYLGASATAPTADPDGSALDLGDLWFDSASDTLKVYAAGGWVNAGSSVNGTSERQTYTATAGQTTFAVTYDAGFVDVWLNGVKLLVGTDFTATSGSNIVLASGAAVNDIVDIIAFGTFALSTHYTKTAADARFEPIGGGGGGYGDSSVDTHLNQSSATTGQYLKWNGSDYAWDTVAAGYANSDVDTHLNQSTATSGKYLKWNGSDYAWDVVPAGYTNSDVDAHLLASGATLNTITSSGDLTVDVVGDIILDVDGGDVKFKDGGTEFSQYYKDGNDVAIYSSISDGNIKFQGKDGGSVVTALTLDMSAAGNAHFNQHAYFTDNGKAIFGGGSDLQIYHDGTNSYVQDAAAGDLILDTNGDSVRISHSGNSETMAQFQKNGFVKLFHNNTTKLETTTAGCTISSSATVSGTNPFVYVQGDGSSYYPYMRVTGLHGGLALGTYYGGNISGNTISFRTGANTADGGTEGMRVLSDQSIAVGSTASGRHSVVTKALILNGSSDGGQFALHCGRVGTGTESQICFSNGYGQVGSIKTSGQSTSFNTSSDYRLKENVTDVTDGITRVKQLSPKRFNFIVEADTTVDGFLAHEAQAVVPEAVTGTKDAMKDEEYTVTAAKGDIVTPPTGETDEVIHSSNVEEPDTLADGQAWRETAEAVMGTRSVPDMQGIDQSKLVPLLTAALQEAIAKIETLETRVTALEAN